MPAHRSHSTGGSQQVFSWSYSSCASSSPRDGTSVRSLYILSSITYVPLIYTYIKLTQNPVAYTLAIYLLNLFLAFLQPKFDPSLTQDEGLEDGQSGLPTNQDDEFRPFIRRLPEFKFWHSATRAISIGFFCTWFEFFNIPVFWPLLLVYWFVLFCLTSTLSPLSSLLVLFSGG